MLQVRKFSFKHVTIVKCDPLSKNLTIIEFELQTVLSVQVAFQLNSDYCTNMIQGLALHHTEI